MTASYVNSYINAADKAKNCKPSHACYYSKWLQYIFYNGIESLDEWRKFIFKVVKASRRYVELKKNKEGKVNQNNKTNLMNHTYICKREIFFSEREKIKNLIDHR